MTATASETATKVADDDAEAFDPTTATLEHLQAELTRQLEDLTAEAGFAAALVDSRRLGLGFLTQEAHEAIGRQHRNDRIALAKRLKKGEATGRGPSPAPLDVGAVSVIASVERELLYLTRAITGHLQRRGVHVIRRLPESPDVAHYAAHLLAVIALVDDPAPLRPAWTVLAAEIQTARDLVNGVGEQTFLGGPCPWCKRPTLVVHWLRADDQIREEFFIRCEKHPNDRHLLACTCSDPLCGCKVSPVTYRHTWALNAPRTAPNSWWRLERYLENDRNTQSATDKKGSDS